MAEIESSLERALASNPAEEVDLILRLESSPPDLMEALEKHGVEVRRRFRLSRSISVRCRGSAALALLDEPWLKRVEDDRPMRALDKGR